MSLTDRAELYEMFQRPVRKKHHPKFSGDGELCDRATGHCTNADACYDCMLHQSRMEELEYEENFKGE